MEQILECAKRLLLPHLKTPGLYLDFTMGNGNDTLYIARHMTDGRLIAFDIQKQALQNTRHLLKEHDIRFAELILDSHENFPRYTGAQEIEAGLFNLGYLPGGEKSTTTAAETTVRTLAMAVERLSPTGIIILVVYPGHEAGREESRQVMAYCQNLDRRKYDAVTYQFINKNSPPYLLAVERRQ